MINCTLLFTVYLKNLPERYLKFLETGIILNLSRDEPISLNSEQVECSMKYRKAEHTLSFIIRKNIGVGLNPNIFWSPFEIIEFIMSVTVQPVKLKDPVNGKPVHIHFNLMDYGNQFMKTSFSEDSQFGHYSLAPNKLKAVYTHER